MTATSRQIQHHARQRRYHLLRIAGSALALGGLIWSAGPKLW